METRQFLRNEFLQVPYPTDPPMPVGTLGDTILATYVPPGEGHAEICHGFTYRWLVAKGKLPLRVAATGIVSFGAVASEAVLFPAGVAGYPSARTGGALQVQTGDLIGMFTGQALSHSLIAETPTSWFSANNAGCFGTTTGRTRVDLTQAFPFGAGWQGHGKQLAPTRRCGSDRRLSAPTLNGSAAEAWSGIRGTSSGRWT